jgi:hypothetical protein
MAWPRAWGAAAAGAIVVNGVEVPPIRKEQGTEMDDEKGSVVENRPLLQFQEVQRAVLAAVASKRRIALAKIDRPAVLIFHARETANAAEAVNTAARARYPAVAVEDLLIASVVDLRIVPRMVRGIAERAMRNAYQEAAAALPAGMTPAEYVLILPDWDGKVTAGMGFQNVNRQAGVAVLAGDGRAAVAQGDDPAQIVMRLLAEVMGE